MYYLREIYKQVAGTNVGKHIFAPHAFNRNRTDSSSSRCGSRVTSGQYMKQECIPVGCVPSAAVAV